MARPATDGPRDVPTEPRKPLWLIPNLLSLDAPLVAVTWLYMFAKTWRVFYLSWFYYVSLALVVWVIYATDRLLDASLRGGQSETLEARHLFHRKHRRIFRWVAVSVGLAAIVLIILTFPAKVYELGLVGAVMVGAFFVLSIFSTPERDEIPYAKNCVAGLAFAYGTAMLAFANTSFEMFDLLRSRELICFAVLCILNISAIDLWEHAHRTPDPEAKAGDELALTLPLTLLGAASLIFAVQDRELVTRSFFYATLTGAALLQILNRTRSRFSMDALRVLADVALLIPFLIFAVSSSS